jgi:hypothetical protein
MPKLSRIKWAPGRKEEFKLWVQRELFNTESDRASLEDGGTRRNTDTAQKA